MTSNSIDKLIIKLDVAGSLHGLGKESSPVVTVQAALYACAGVLIVLQQRRFPGV